VVVPRPYGAGVFSIGSMGTRGLFKLPRYATAFILRYRSSSRFGGIALLGFCFPPRLEGLDGSRAARSAAALSGLLRKGRRMLARPVCRHRGASAARNEKCSGPITLK